MCATKMIFCVYISGILVGMSEQHNNDHEEMLRLMRENSVLIQENNKLLHKLYRHSILGFTVKIIWFAIIIG